MKVSKKLLVKDKTSMGAKIVGKKVPAKVDTGKIAVDFPEKKLMASSRSRKQAVNAMPKIKRSPPLFINESETTEGPYIYVDEKDVEVSIEEENSVVHINEDEIVIGNPYECKYCQKICMTNSSLTRHEKLHSGIRPFSCKYCPKSFTITSQLKNHERRHTGDEPYNCSKCNKGFFSPSVLKQHETICPGKKGTNVDKTKDKEKQFSCIHCPKKFVSMTSLQIHEIIHTGEKPFDCKVCGKKFNQKGNAKTHEALHYEDSGIKGQFSCRFCNEKFHYHHVMIRHLKIHTNGKPYDCTYCGKLWAKKSRLEPHEKSCKRRMERKQKKRQ